MAENLYRKVLKIIPNHFETNFLLGSLSLQIKNFSKAIQLLNKAISIKPNHANAHYNLGLVFLKLKEFKKAILYCQKAIQIQPDHAEAYNNLGTAFYELGDRKKAKKYYQKTIQINPNYVAAYWNLHSFASDIDEALTILKKICLINSKYLKAKIAISALEGFKGNFKNFDSLINSSYANDPFMRSIKWIFSLHRLPKIFFNRWNFFDATISLTDQSRPFYEFGVWNGISFQYLINTFGKGFWV